MRREKRWRYYCDYCKKSGGSGGHMKRHERGCTMNPERACGMCAISGEDQQPMPKLLAAVNGGGLPALEDAANECPACILATLRQVPWTIDDLKTLNFDYQEARKAFWAGHNQTERERDHQTYA